MANWKLNISSSKRSMITKLCRIVTNDEGNSPIVSHDSLTTKSREVTWQTKFLLLHNACEGWLMATKLGRVVTYDEGNSPIMSDDPLITWSCEVTWQIENFISPLLQGLWPQNMTGWGLLVKETSLWSHMILRQYGHVWSRDKLKA